MEYPLPPMPPRDAALLTTLEPAQFAWTVPQWRISRSYVDAAERWVTLYCGDRAHAERVEIVNELMRASEDILHRRLGVSNPRD